MTEELQHIRAIMTGDGATWFRYLSLVGIFLLGFWKALPAVLDSFERRQSGVELRIESLLDAQSKRFNEQLAAADDRHEECMEGQRLLRDEVDALRKENGEMRGLLAAMQQGQLAVSSVVARTIKEAKDHD